LLEAVFLPLRKSCKSVQNLLTLGDFNNKLMLNILVPTDFSDCANNATEAAASIAKRTGAKLYIMHIINMPTYESNTTIETVHNVPEALFIMKHVRKKFAALMSLPMFEGIDLEEIIEFNTVYEAISEHASKVSADLIIMGTHGASGREEFLVGSNTERVIRTAEVPVLTIKNRHQNFDVKDIVFASNFFEESYGIFENIKSFARAFNARIHLLKVVTPSHFETTRYSIKLMESFVKATNLDVDHSINIYNDSKIENGIHHFTEEISADMIAMETHGRTGIQHMLWGSITESVANHSKIPILSMKIPKEVESEVIFPD